MYYINIQHDQNTIINIILLQLLDISEDLNDTGS